MVPIVAQRRDAVRRYIEETGFPFDILIDETRDVSRAFGVWHRIGLDAWNVARPALFLVDRAGVVRYSFVAPTQKDFPSQDAIFAELDRLGGPRV